MIRKLTVAFLFLFVATSLAYPRQTYNPNFNLYSLSDFNQRYEVETFGYPYGLCFGIIHNKETGMYAFGRGMKYKEDGRWHHVFYQRAEFIYTEVGIYKPYPIQPADPMLTPHYLLPVKMDGKWGFADLGSYGWAPILRVPCIYDGIDMTSFVNDEYGRVKTGERWIVIDWKNNEVRL